MGARGRLRGRGAWNAFWRLLSARLLTPSWKLRARVICADRASAQHRQGRKERQASTSGHERLPKISVTHDALGLVGRQTVVVGERLTLSECFARAAVHGCGCDT